MRRKTGGGPNPELFFQLAGVQSPVSGNKLVWAYGPQLCKVTKMIELEERIIRWASIYFLTATTPERERMLIMEMYISCVLDFGESGCDYNKAWNMTAILLWLKNRGYLRFHDVMEPVVIKGLFRTKGVFASVVEATGRQLLIDEDDSHEFA